MNTGSTKTTISTQMEEESPVNCSSFEESNDTIGFKLYSPKVNNPQFVEPYLDEIFAHLL